MTAGLCKHVQSPPPTHTWVPTECDANVLIASGSSNFRGARNDALHPHTHTRCALMHTLLDAARPGNPLGRVFAETERKKLVLYRLCANRNQNSKLAAMSLTRMQPPTMTRR
jgi:hypothetical protein